MSAYCNLLHVGYDEHVHAYLLHCVRLDVEYVLSYFTDAADEPYYGEDEAFEAMKDQY